METGSKQITITLTENHADLLLSFYGEAVDRRNKLLLLNNIFKNPKGGELELSWNACQGLAVLLDELSEEQLWTKREDAPLENLVALIKDAKKKAERQEAVA